MKLVLPFLTGTMQGLFNEVPSSFSVDSFAQGSFEGKGDTRRLRIEPKKGYSAIIEGPWQEKGKTGLRIEKGYLILDVMWRVNDPEQATRLGVEKLPLVRQSIFLDVTPAGGLDMAPFKNGDLNRLRDALGLNNDGQRWQFSDFIGKAAKIDVDQRPNEKNPQDPYTNVTAVTKLS